MLSQSPWLSGWHPAPFASDFRQTSVVKIKKCLGCNDVSSTKLLTKHYHTCRSFHQGSAYPLRSKINTTLYSCVDNTNSMTPTSNYLLLLFVDEGKILYRVQTNRSLKVKIKAIAAVIFSHGVENMRYSAR